MYLSQQDYLFMGNGQNTKTKTNNNTKTGNDNALIKQYAPAFQKHKTDPQYFINLFNQIPTFIKNLFDLFPEANTSVQGFAQMVVFLTKQDGKFSICKYAISNAAGSSIMDRFLMVGLKVDQNAYSQKKVSVSELENIMAHYFAVFVPNVQQKIIQKILKFMRIQQSQFNLKQFVLNFRDYFPYAHRFLKDYFSSKFIKMQQQGHILRHFTSKIITTDAAILALKIPSLANPQIVQLYNTQKYGLGFHSIQKQLVGYTGPWLMLIHHFQKNQKGQRQYYILGAYQTGPIRNIVQFQGDVTGMLFSIQPQIKFFTTDKGEGSSHYFFINSLPQQKSKKRKGFGFGGSKFMQGCKLWIDGDLDRSYVSNGKDVTYGYGALASPGTSVLNIKRMEVWGLGNRFNYEEQMQYWQQRELEIAKRRKVDKRQLLGNNAGLFFGIWYEIQRKLLHIGNKQLEIYKQIRRKRNNSDRSVDRIMQDAIFVCFLFLNDVYRCLEYIWTHH